MGRQSKGPSDQLPLENWVVESSGVSFSDAETSADQAEAVPEQRSPGTLLYAGQDPRKRPI